MDHCETQTYHFSDDGTIPNNRLPLVVFRQCLSADQNVVRSTLEQNGWGGIWIDGVYDYNHYHSTAHEFMGVLEGTATVLLGGDNGETLDITKGDVLILPAGTGHKCVISGPAFQVMGAYPDGQKWDLLTGKPGEHDQALQNIPKVPLPKNDPLNGAEGALLKIWGK